MAKGDSGLNGSISAAGYGTRKVRILTLQRRLGIISTADSEAKSRRAFYPIVTTGSSFTMSVGFISYEERERFNEWMSRFLRDTVNDIARSGVMTVRMPSRDLLRTCVLESDLNYGEGLTDMMYTLTMDFIGASDPVDLDLGTRMAGISYFRGPRGNQASRYFYPAGRQVAGAEQLDGTTYDSRSSGSDFDQEVNQPITHLPEGI